MDEEVTSTENEEEVVGELEDLIIGKAKEWQIARTSTIEQLVSVAEAFDRQQKTSNIVNVSSSSAGLLGGSLILVGILATPLTAGLSLGLTFTGTALASGSAITKIVATTAEFNNIKSLCKKAEELLENDRNITSELVSELEKVKKLSFKAYNVLKSVINFGTLIQPANYIIHTTDALLIGGDIFAKSITATFKASFLIFGMGIDLFSTIRSSIKLTEGSRSEYAKNVRKIIEELQKDLLNSTKTDSEKTLPIDSKVDVSIAEQPT